MSSFLVVGFRELYKVTFCTILNCFHWQFGVKKISGEVLDILEIKHAEDNFSSDRDLEITDFY